LSIDRTHQKQAELLPELHQSLGIAADYGERCGLPLCYEPEELVATELDYYARPQQLTGPAFEAWTAMKAAALEQDITLFLISAYRSPQHQHDLIARKLQQGQLIEQILAVNAAPGYSEHHSGRAVDLGTPDCAALVTEFEHTAAFNWLGSNANNFGFVLSYPRENRFGIDYEPWHWCFHGD
jgi:D-alanyl-D-alanine carboxypeptidase